MHLEIFFHLKHTFIENMCKFNRLLKIITDFECPTSWEMCSTTQVWKGQPFSLTSNEQCSAALSI